MSARTTARAVLASETAKANKNPTPEARARVEDLRTDYQRIATAERIATLVASAPPLTQAQVDKLTVLLRGGL